MSDAASLVAALQSQGKTLAVAESCTGGLLGAAITDVPGASAVFLGGIIAYGDTAKNRVLDVPKDKLEKVGAVSGAVVEAMAHATRDRFGCDLAIAISGIAGPTGARPGKPVGTVWLAVLGPGHLMDVHRIHIDGDRDQVRQETVQESIALALEALKEAEKEAA